MSIFDKEATQYDDWYETNIGLYVANSETNLLLSMIDEGKNVLDVCCGTGFHTLKVKEISKSIIGIDHSSEMLEIAQNKSKDITFIEMDAMILQFEDESFDVVFSLAGIEFVSNPQKMIDECMRVLKPGGQLLIGTIQKGGQWANLYESEWFRENTVFKYANFLSELDLKKMNNQFVVAKGCLFHGPDLDDLEYCNLNDFEKDVLAGFIIAEYRKEGKNE